MYKNKFIDLTKIFKILMIHVFQLPVAFIKQTFGRVAVR